MIANRQSINMLARAINEYEKSKGELSLKDNWTIYDVCYVCMAGHNGNINSMAAQYKRFLFADGV